MKRTAAILTLIMIELGALALFAQQQPTKPEAPAAQKVTPKAPYDSTKAQLWSEKEKNLQLQAVQMNAGYQQQMKDLQGKYGDVDKQLNEWIAEVRKANGWDDAYTYDRETDSWSHAAKPETAKAPDRK